MMKAFLLLTTFLSGIAFPVLPNINGDPVLPAGKNTKAAPFNGGEFQIKTIVIDPGHGGHDPGCSGASSKEKHLCLAIGKYFAEALRNNYPDLKVILTRSTDVFIPLHERASIATHNRADLFISIHCNYIPKASGIHGTETYVLGLHATEANLEVAKRENSSILFEDNYQETYGYDPNSPEAHIMLSMFQNAFLEQSILFAEKVQQHSSFEADRKDRGVKQAGFLVLRHATMPSVLVETGYLSNHTEEQYLRTSKGQKEMANALLMAFHDYKLEMETGRTNVSIAPPKKLEVENETEEAAYIPEAEVKLPAGEPYAAQKNDEVKAVAVKQESRASSLTVEGGKASNKSEPALSNIEKSAVPEPGAFRQVNKGKILASAPIETKAPEPETSSVENADVQYRVQLAASPRPLNVASGRWTSISYLVEVIVEDNLYKYQVRNFATPDEANEAKLKLRASGFNDAFVVAYQNGKRVNPKN